MTQFAPRIAMLSDDWAPPSSDDEHLPDSQPAAASAACPREGPRPASAAAGSAACPRHERPLAKPRQPSAREAKRQGGGKVGGVPKFGGVTLKRKLQRRATEAKPPQADVLKMICVWGGSVRHPVPVWPLFREGDAYWLQVSERSHWLRRACDQRGRTHYRDTCIRSRVAPKSHDAWKQ